MRNLLRTISDGLLSAAFGVFMISLHFSLLSVFKANLQRPFAVQHYRPVYSRSGRRNRIRF
jgi:hypothetical protein